VLAFGAAADVSKPRSRPAKAGWELRSIVGLAMRNTAAFRPGFAAAWGPIVAVWAPILIYLAWATW
jgi:hypothetical protein